jgi:hypothetical protein
VTDKKPALRSAGRCGPVDSGFPSPPPFLSVRNDPGDRLNVPPSSFPLRFTIKIMRRERKILLYAKRVNRGSLRVGSFSCRTAGPSVCGGSKKHHGRPGGLKEEGRSPVCGAWDASGNRECVSAHETRAMPSRHRASNRESKEALRRLGSSRRSRILRKTKAVVRLGVGAARHSQYGEPAGDDRSGARPQFGGPDGPGGVVSFTIHLLSKESLPGTWMTAARSVRSPSHRDM